MWAEQKMQEAVVHTTKSEAETHEEKVRKRVNAILAKAGKFAGIYFLFANLFVFSVLCFCFCFWGFLLNPLPKGRGDLHALQEGLGRRGRGR